MHRYRSEILLAIQFGTAWQFCSPEQATRCFMQGRSDWHSEILSIRKALRSTHMTKNCTHLNQIRVTTTGKRVCEECIRAGDTWIHLRLCLSCGFVGCCDDSTNKHARK